MRLAAEAWLASLAAVALLAGTCVYLLDRDWTTALFLSPIAGFQTERHAVFGALGETLPSFLHAYAFALLIAAALWPWPRTRAWACIGWFAIAAALECMQAPGIAGFLSDRQYFPGDFSVFNALSGYAAQGKFDLRDLWATAFGCLTAYVTMIIIRRRP
jgi:hypothetical protein